jgi:hypothetical protein
MSRRLLVETDGPGGFHRPYLATVGAVIREDKERVTGDRSRFVPHAIV